ncbi:MAG: type II secretion system F family protein [Acidimicrobiales bacterium]
MTALAAVFGAGAGLGLILVVSGLRGTHAATTATVANPRRWQPRVEHLGARLSGALAAAVVVGAVTRWPVGAILAGLAGWATPALWAGRGGEAATTARIEAVATWTEMLRDTLAGAAGLEQAISASAPVAPMPIRAEVAQLAARAEHDRLAPALRGFADDLADPTADLVVAALLLAVEHRARRLGELLGSLAAAAREHAGMRLRVQAGRARTRTSVRVVVGATLAMAAGLALADRGYLAPYNSALGQLVLAGVGAIFTGAFTWLARMARPEPTGRLLAAVDSPGAGGVT